MPIEDLESRSVAFQEALRGIEAERRSVQDLLAGDRKRAGDALEAEADALRRACREHLTAVAEQAIRRHDKVIDDAIYEMIRSAVPDFLERNLHAATARARQKIEQILNRHQARANSLVERVRQTAANLFEIPFHPAEPPEPFGLGSEPYWVTRPTAETLMPSPENLLLRFLSPAARQRRLRRRLNEQIAALAQRNVENLRWAILRGLDDTFRRFATRLDERLSQVRMVTEGVIGSGLEQRHARSNEVAAQLDHFGHLAYRLEDLRTELDKADGHV